ncbi:MAG: hypothetical protein ABEJ85_05835, partial [Haloarculaceae archaeon]
MEDGDKAGTEMVELSPVTVGVVVVVAVVGAVPVAATSVGGAATPTDGANTAVTNASLAPGERLAAVVSVQQTDIEAEIGARAFGHRIAQAASNTSKAGIVEAELDQLRERLAELRETKRELEAAYRNGTLSEGQYTARLAVLHAKTRAIERQLNATARVARGLPAAALEAKGIDASAIQRLKREARNLTGPEVAAIARQIAGKKVGKGIGRAERGPPAFVANESEGPGRSGGQGQGPPANGSTGPNAANGSAGSSGGNASAGPNAGSESAESGGSDRGSSGKGDDRNPPTNGTSASTPPDDGTGDPPERGTSGDASDSGNRRAVGPGP